MDTVTVFVILASALHCDGVSIQEQLEHIASRRAESQRRSHKRSGDTRRYAMFGSDSSVILGAPSYASHLPEAEPILPGHTLVRPAMGMLKSAIKFPHREQENGAGVYGHIDNLGIKYDGKNERVLYSGFRRMVPERPMKYLLNSFNHIKINPDAPELSDLLPDLSTEKSREWWFYHQSDFEEFEDR